MTDTQLKEINKNLTDINEKINGVLAKMLDAMNTNLLVLVCILGSDNENSDIAEFAESLKRQIFQGKLK